MDSTTLITMFGAFLAIMNPFVVLPVFLAMTDGYEASQQRALVLRIAVYSLTLCAIIILTGNGIISFFGVSVDQFRVAGGIVLAGIAWSMLNGAPSSSHSGTKQEQGQMADLDSIAFYPISFPMIMGPGSIATLTLYSSHAEHASDLMVIGGMATVVLCLMFLTLFFASAFSRVLSETMRTITTRLMGMILLAISVAMITDGLRAIFPVLERG